MKSWPIASFFAAVSLLAAAPAFACGSGEPGDPPCVTRVESGWTFDSELHDSEVRTRVQTLQWVWDDASGQWVQQLVLVDRSSQDREEHQQFDAWQSSFSGAAWDWGW